MNTFTLPNADISAFVSFAKRKQENAKAERDKFVRQLAEGRRLAWDNGQNLIQAQTEEMIWQEVVDHAQDLDALLGWCANAYRRVKNYGSGGRSTSQMANAIEEGEIDATRQEIRSVVQAIAFNIESVKVEDLELEVIRRSGSFGGLL